MKSEFSEITGAPFNGVRVVPGSFVQHSIQARGKANVRVLASKFVLDEKKKFNRSTNEMETIRNRARLVSCELKTLSNVN